MIRRPPRSTQSRSSAASDVYKRQDHLGLKGIDTLDQLAEVKRVVIEVAKDCAVLNADDPRVLRMSGYTEAKSICYVTMNPQHGLVREHIRAGGRACALEAGVNGQMITLYDRSSHIPLVWTHLIPATLEGRALHNVQNAMFAAAMAFSLGIKLDAIRQGLRTFDTTFFQAPGRMNVFTEHPFKVLFDYGHNAHAVGVMADLAQRLDVVGRRIGTLGQHGAGGHRAVLLLDHVGVEAGVGEVAARLRLALTGDVGDLHLAVGHRDVDGGAGVDEGRRRDALRDDRAGRLVGVDLRHLAEHEARIDEGGARLVLRGEADEVGHARLVLAARHGDVDLGALRQAVAGGRRLGDDAARRDGVGGLRLSLIHISEPTRPY